MKIRGAISGFGEVAARAHLPGWNKRDNVSLAVVHDPVSARRHEAIRLIKNVRVYDDLELMLTGEALEFVDIASPPAFHAPVARAALEAGAHVLVEKPMCLTRGEFLSLEAIARSNRRVFMCVHNWKFAPPYVAASRAISEDRIGAVVSIEFERFRSAPAGSGASGGQWRAGAASGGGILIDHGWHVFYLMQSLFDAAPISVSASLGFPENSDVDDRAEVAVSFADGRTAKAKLSWRARERRTTAKISGERGTIEIDGDRVILKDRMGNRSAISVADAPDDSYHAAWFGGVAALFEGAISRGPGCPDAATNLSESRNCLEIILAARESSSLGGREVAIAGRFDPKG
jgi:predicted dehydrogenase